MPLRPPKEFLGLGGGDIAISRIVRAIWWSLFNTGAGGVIVGAMIVLAVPFGFGVTLWCFAWSIDWISHWPWPAWGGR